MIQFRSKQFGIASGLKNFLGPEGMRSLAISGILKLPEIKLAKDQMKEEEYQQERNRKLRKEELRIQERDSKRRAAALKELAKIAKENPEVAAEAYAQEVQREYSGDIKLRLKKVFKDGLQVARDINTTFNKDGALNKKVAKGIAGGLTAAGLAYGTNKLIAHDARKHGLLEERTEEEKKEARKKRRHKLAKLALGTGAAAGSAILATMAAKKGTFGSTIQKFAEDNLTKDKLKDISKRVASDIKEGFKDQFKPSIVKDENGKPVLIEKIITDSNGNKKTILREKKSYLGPALTIGFGLSPLLSYLPLRLQKRNQEKSSKVKRKTSDSDLEEREYAVVANALDKSSKKLAKLSKKVYDIQSEMGGDINNKRHSILKGISSSLGNLGKKAETGKINVISFKRSPLKHVLNGLSNKFNGGGIKGIHNFTLKLSDTVKGNNHEATKKFIKFIQNHKKTALAGTIALGALSIKPFVHAQGLGRKAAELVDTDAFAYEKANKKSIADHEDEDNNNSEERKISKKNNIKKNK